MDWLEFAWWVVYVLNVGMILFALVFGYLPFAKFYLWNAQVEVDERYLHTYCDGSLNCWNKSVEDVVLTNGFYSYDGFFCVRTDASWSLHVDKTVVHESCHALVDSDEEHFCGGGVVE